MVVYFSCQTLGDCHRLVLALNGRKVPGMSKYPLTAEVAAPQGTTGKAGGLAPTRAKMGGMPWRFGVPWPPPPQPRAAAPASASAPARPAAPPLMVSTAKVTSPVAPPVLIAPKSLALNKQCFFYMYWVGFGFTYIHIFF